MPALPAGAPPRRLTRPMIAVAAAAALAVPADALLMIVNPDADDPVLAVTHAAVAAVWIAAGLVAWRRHPALRTGPLMAAVGFLWIPSQLYGWQTAAAVTLASTLDNLGIAVALQLFVSFPSGRLHTPVERALVGAAYVDAVLIGGLLPQLFLGPEHDFCDECGPNWLLVQDSPAAYGALRGAAAAIGIALCLTIAWLLWRRWRAAGAAGRAVLGPVLLTGATAVLAILIVIAVDWVSPFTGAAEIAGVWLAWSTWALVPLAFLLGLLRARLRRAAVTALMVELGRLPGPQRVRDALARALGDPSLRLAFWLPEERRYVGLDGEDVTLGSGAPGRVVTTLEHEGERFAALEHDGYLLEDRELLDAVGAAARLAIENAHLQAELSAQLEEVRSSRARIVEAGDRERRRIERDLHDGAQQRLLAIRLSLRLVRGRLGAGAGEAEAMLAEADEEMRAALEELRSLARGIHPAVLTDVGLHAALASLARRAPVPVELRGVPEGRLPAPVEAAAYFFCSEALANVAKHARATCVTIDAELAAGRLRVAVSDDGVGGAEGAAGSGLAGLRDRIEALDGSLRVESPAGRGTRLIAELPCAPHDAPLQPA